ncbi:membrane protein insertase YidC [Azohydromonas caseinilytica]|uniref:Membrane protein insertase YidC n=1 Tax=Azohydromonas caseinilytica TaxID=2728836 RepID=A0A848FK91_9BURK|nr:membrane protein insertase YidC [Azohydromonas caseinilytica]NML18653.1 membrane protein insertase YidC [Azohydromonas caseinilytica]
MTDIRRTLLWVVFTMSLVLLWDAWNKHNGQPSFFGPRTTATAPAAGAGTPPASAPAGVPTPAATATAPGAAPVAAAAAAPVAAQQVTLTTDVVKATFSSLGGDLVRLELLNQVDEHEPGKRVVLFDRSAERTYLAQTGLVSATGAPLPTHLTPMNVAPGPRELKEGNELQLRFESPEVGGVQLVKTYTLRRGEYTVGVRHEVINRSAAPVTPQLYLQLVRDGKALPGGSSFYSTFTGPALYTEASKFHKVSFEDIAKGKAEHDKRADNGWIAMVQHYYASAWLVNQAQPREFRSAKIGNDLYSIAMVLPLGEVAPGATKAQDAQLFAGPQEEKRLEAIAPGLELVKDYGYFAILSKPLFWLLDKLHGMLKNWGWSIIALVVLLKIAFYWLNANAYKSMAKMKAVNPRIMALRERYKDNPQQLQTEMMRIYREEKVNPLGGCLPIFIQMPFFIALYWVLLSSVEMRNAPWIGWITDLSAKDPYFILPLLMTASTMLQTWLNPTPPDPVQAKMMWIMPLAFSVMFFFFPAGLVLYWLTNNLLSIAQQYLINKRLGVLNT